MLTLEVVALGAATWELEQQFLRDSPITSLVVNWSGIMKYSCQTIQSFRYRTGQGQNRIEPACSQVTGSKCRADDIGKVLHTVEGLLQRVPLEIEHQSLYATLGKCPYVLNDLFD